MRGYVVKGPLDCHIWEGAASPRGYPVMRLQGRVQQVRRVVYEREKRPLLPGERVSMACGERLCVNASHMIAVMARSRFKDADEATG